MKRLTPLLLALILTALFPGCDNYDDDRIPERAVHIEIYSAQWSIYGVYAYTDWREFIKNSLPKGFSWSANSYTGFGGVLLVCGLNNQLLAYDLACPVECSSSTRIEVDEENCVALCSVCGSTYDIFNGYGQPVSGPAREKKYGLTSYTVNYTSTGYLISR
ncbi:MAG: hypothetical protein LUI04_05460 [Porphyromonadaceae bacterium]|nr:hypothetical protein [Porphyromonadaceae bacterium]